MSITKTKESPSFDDAFYRTVELSNGKRMTVQAWGVEDVRANFTTLQEILNDLLNQDDKTRKKISNDPKAFSDFVDKQFNRFVTLLESSLTDDSPSLSEVRGLDNLMELIEAVVEVNGLFRAVGKLTVLAQKASSMMATN